MTSDGRPAASWFPDPLGRHEHRYWDGERWTVHVADNGVTGVDGGAQQPVVQQPVVEQPIASQPAANETVIPERRPVTPQSQPAQQPWTPASGWQTPAAASTTPAPVGSSVAKVWIFAVAFLVAVAGIGLTAMLALGRNSDSSSASGGEPYPAIVQTNFMNSCTATGGTTNYRRCALDHLEQDVDLEEFAGMEQEYLKTGQLPESVMSAVRACIPRQLTP